MKSDITGKSRSEKGRAVEGDQRKCTTIAKMMGKVTRRVSKDQARSDSEVTTGWRRGEEKALSLSS